MKVGPLTLLTGAGGALLTAALIAWPRDAGAPPPAAPAAPFVPAPAQDIDGALARDLFGAAAPAPTDGEAEGAPPEAAADPESPPAVVGIVGRLDRDALVLVRRAGGGTRSLAVGESAGGWRLESIAADAVLFAREGRRVRVELPAG